MIVFCIQIIILTKCYSLMTGILTSHCKVAPLLEWLSHHQKVVQFCNKNFYIFAQEYKTLAYVSCAATRAPIVKT